MNTVILVGRLGADPEIRHLESGKSVANFNIATNRTKDITDWHKVTVWGNAVDVIEKYVKKGSQVGVNGSLQTRSYEKDGQTRYVTEVVCYNISLIGSKNEISEQSNTSIDKKDESYIDDDLPF